MSIFVARLILHLDIKSVCVRARAGVRVNLCVRDEDKEPRASKFFVTWWVVQFRSFKKPLY